MLGIEEPVRFSRSESRRNDENRSTLIMDEPVADLCEFSRRRTLAPVSWELFRGDRRARDRFRDLRHDNHEVLGQVLSVNVDKILDHCEREVLGGVRQARAHARPAPAKTVPTLSVERTF